MSDHLKCLLRDPAHLEVGGSEVRSLNSVIIFSWVPHEEIGSQIALVLLEAMSNCIFSSSHFSQISAESMCNK